MGDEGQQAIDELRGLAVTAISDALDRLGHPGALADIAPLDAGLGTSMIGRARTVRQAARSGGAVTENLTRHASVVDFGIERGDVVVISCPADVDASTWGYLLSLRCTHLGASGTVIDGSARDPAEIVELGYPLFTRLGRHNPSGSKLRLETVAVDEPVVIGQVTIAPGAIVVGDSSGVVVCPPELAAKAAGIAREIIAWEDACADRILSGETLTGS